MSFIDEASGSAAASPEPVDEDQATDTSTLLAGRKTSYGSTDASTLRATSGSEQIICGDDTGNEGTQEDDGQSTNDEDASIAQKQTAIDLEKEAERTNSS